MEEPKSSSEQSAVEGLDNVRLFICLFMYCCPIKKESAEQNMLGYGFGVDRLSELRFSPITNRVTFFANQN